MAEEVKWIKIKVGMFDGESFKRIKRAKIGGEKFRDKLTAVWFELLDLSGKCNNNGFLVNNEIAYQSYEDIAIMLDRDEEEIELCMKYYLSNNMIEIIDNCYCLANWCKYQNVDGLEKIKEKNRLRVAKHRENQKLLLGNSKENECNVTSNVTVMLPSQDIYISNSNSISNSNNNINIKEDLYNSEVEDVPTKSKKFVKPTMEEIKDYCLNERKNNVDYEKFYAYYESNGWKVGKNPMKNWKACVITWERTSNNASGTKNESTWNVSSKIRKMNDEATYDIDYNKEVNF